MDYYLLLPTIIQDNQGKLLNRAIVRVYRSSRKVPLFFPVLNKLEFSRHIL
jgi:hypothetical protein